MLTASWSGTPLRIRLTGTSSFLPFRVRGTSGMAKISSGTCRGERLVRMAAAIPRLRSASSTAPSRIATNR